MASKPTQKKVAKQNSRTFEEREEQYKRLNDELEAKTANLVKEAEEVLKAQDNMLSSKSHLLENVDSHNLLSGFEDDTPDPMSSRTQSSILDTYMSNKNSRIPSKPHSAKKTAGGNSTLRSKTSNNNSSTGNPKSTPRDDDMFLTETIHKLEDQLGDLSTDPDPYDNVLPQTATDIGSEAQLRFLKAKVRVMQEEIDKLAEICKEKDEESSKLHAKLKEIEDDRNRTQRTLSNQQNQIEKYKRLAEEANGRTETSDSQLSSIRKELDGLKRSQKQQSSTQSVTEVRLNRALEDAAKYKEQLQKVKASCKETQDQDKHKMDAILTENRKLEKQKNELITGFRKQLKLIDILKRQKMHIEAAKMLAFTEEEFVKALEWGN